MVSAQDRKEWAREVFRGASVSVRPSFTPDYSALDEEAVRASVRHSRDQGYFAVGTLGVGLGVEEDEELLRIVIDEADDDLEIYGHAGGGSIENEIDHVQRMEQLGCSHFSLNLPKGFSSVIEMYDYVRQICDATSMGVVLYGTNNNDFRHLDTSNIVFEAYRQIVDIPNVIAMKMSQIMDPITSVRCAEFLGDKVLLGPVNLELAPVLAMYCPIQWSGIWAVDALQSPKKRYVVEFMDLLRQHRLSEAEDLYYQFRTLLQLFWDVQAPWVRRGQHPHAHLKYFNYCSGGNGGLLREPNPAPLHEGFPPLLSEDREQIRAAFEKVGISTSELSDEEAMVGRVAYARGVRVSDLASNGTWR